MALKEDITCGTEISADDIEASEFTELVSRGKLRHPPHALFDLSQYIYTFFKTRPNKCCTKIFLEAYRYIYESTGYEFKDIEKILVRFNNCFFKGYAKNESDKIVSEKNNKMKKRKLTSS